VFHRAEVKNKEKGKRKKEKVAQVYRVELRSICSTAVYSAE